MKFSLRKLFSIVDGRLSTKMEDVYEMLNHITGESLMTHHLPVAMKFIESKNLPWFREVAKEIKKLKDESCDDFSSIMDYIKNQHNPIYEVPPLTDKEKEGLDEYMVENSLMIRFANQKK